MSFSLLQELDAFHDFLGQPMIVSCGTQGQHEKNSLHYVGSAVDLIFPRAGKAGMVDVLFAAMRFGFTGIGIYPDWELHGVKLGGLHLDNRVAPSRALWLGVIENGGRVYKALSVENLTDAGLL